jgi:hypothetical protein
MRRLALALSLALVMLLGLVATVGSRTSAQEATPAAAAISTHPIVGTWLATLTGTGGTWAETFAADDSVIIAFPPTENGDPIAGADGVTYLSPAVGVWEPTGPHSVAFTVVQTLSDATGASLGTVTIAGHLKLSADGQTFVDDWKPGTTLTYRDLHQTVVQSFAVTPDTPPLRAVRMRVGAPGFPPAGTPIAGTPTP